MKEQIELQNKIRSNLDLIKIKNPQFSLRAYAKKLDLSPSALSEILNGKRKISKKMASRILDRMNLSPAESNKVLDLFDKKAKGLDFEESPTTDTGPANINFLQLSSDQFNMIAEWQHFALLSLMETKGFKSDVPWIAKKLGLSQALITAALDRLIRLGFVFKKNRKYVTNKRALLTSDNIPNQAVRKSHYVDLGLAEKALDTRNVEERDFTAITIAANKKNLAKAKKMIRDFQDKLTLCLEEGEKDEVYKFTFYLYPLTKNSETKD
jgi:uncharacterized protein (TIGR02147 family)